MRLQDSSVTSQSRGMGRWRLSPSVPVSSERERQSQLHVSLCSLQNVLVLLAVLLECKSEAFANGFFSRSVHLMPRGGSSAAATPQSAASTTTTTTTKQELFKSGGVNGEHFEPSLRPEYTVEGLNGKKEYPQSNGAVKKNGVVTSNGVQKRRNGARANGAAVITTTAHHASVAAASLRLNGAASTPGLGTYDLERRIEAEGDEGLPFDQVIPASFIAETNLPTSIGHFRLRAYRTSSVHKSSPFVGTEPCVIYASDKPPFGDAVDMAEGVPVRVHDQCLTSEVFGSQRCDCQEQLKMALEYIQQHGGAIIYLQQEGRGIGFANKVAAYALQDGGMDTVDANLHLGFPEDCRQYGVIPSILDDMRIGSIQLMTNNPRKVEKLSRLGVSVISTTPMVIPKANPYNQRYLETKQMRMNHTNFGSILQGTPQESSPIAPLNGRMGPRKSFLSNARSRTSSADAAAIANGDAPSTLAKDFAQKVEEMAANAIRISLLESKTIPTQPVVLEKPQEGVTASDDGYCFGRKSVEEAIAAISRGEMVVVVDDMNRENEGDFIMAAELCTPESMAQIIRYSSGVVCVAMEGKRMDELKLPPMVSNNEDPKGTAFSVSVDAAKERGVTTGISAKDRSITVQLLANKEATFSDFARPGHLFPLRAREGGVLTRDGHTEATVDLSRLAGLEPCGVLCEIVSEENPTEMARLPELKIFARKHGLVLTSIVDLQQYRRDTGL